MYSYCRFQSLFNRSNTILRASCSDPDVDFQTDAAEVIRCADFSSRHLVGEISLSFTNLALRSSSPLNRTRLGVGKLKRHRNIFIGLQGALGNLKADFVQRLRFLNAIQHILKPKTVFIYMLQIPG
jgi:hypothetical protein